jgi:hypothetical protein
MWVACEIFPKEVTIMPRRSLIGALALATLLAAGAQGAILVVMVLVDKPVERFFESPNPGHLRVHRSGKVVLQQPAGGFRYLSGRHLDNTDVLRWLYQGGPSEPWLSPAWLPGRLTQHQRRLRLGWTSRLRELPGDPQVTWFIVHSALNDGLAYFIGYDVATKNLFGFLGQKGFRSSPPPQGESFPMAGEPSTRLAANASGGRTPAGLAAIVSTPLLPGGLVYLAADERIWEVDLNGRSARVLFDSPTTVSLAAATGANGEAELLVRTSSEAIAINLEGRRRTSWKIPPELLSSDFQWYEFANGSALAQKQRQDGNAIYVDLTWLAHDGEISKTQELEAYYGLNAGARVTYLLLSAATPSPLTMTYIAAIGTPSSAVNRGAQPDFPTAFAHELPDAWPALLLIYVVSAALAWLAYRRQVRFALPGAAAWAAFVFLLGVPGWLAYRWHRRGPVLEPCGECHKPAPRDRDKCASCGQVFAPPTRSGMEIFA